MIEIAGPRHTHGMDLQLSTSLLLGAFTAAALNVACTIKLPDACETADCMTFPESCEALEDQSPANSTATTIEIRNVGDVPLFVPEHGGHELFDLEVDGVLMVVDPVFPNLHCAVIDEPPDDECAEEPLEPDSARVVRIDPGESFVSAWDGYVWDYVEIADECFGGPLCEYGGPVHCYAGRKVELGSTLAMRTYAARSCTVDAGECSCPQGEAACEIPFEPWGFDQPMLADPSEVSEVELEFTGEAIVLEISG